MVRGAGGDSPSPRQVQEGEGCSPPDAKEEEGTARILRPVHAVHPPQCLPLRRAHPWSLPLRLRNLSFSFGFLLLFGFFHGLE